MPRPTKSKIRFVQTIGRGLRPEPGKDHLIVLDHAGNHRRLGLVADIGSNVLDDGAGVLGAERDGKAAPNIRLCPECHCVLPPLALACPQCGHAVPALPPPVELRGELVEFCVPLGRSGEAEWLGALQHIAWERGYKPGWAAHQFRNRFGKWPNRVAAMPTAPTPEILRGVKEQQETWRKAQGGSHG